MKTAALAAALLAAESMAANAGTAVALSPTEGRAEAERRFFVAKPAPTYSATPREGFGAQVRRNRAKSKAASKQRTRQRMRAKGKR